MSILKLHDWPNQQLVSKIWYRSFEKDEQITPIRTIPDLGVEFYLILDGAIKLETERKSENFHRSYVRGLVDGFGEFKPNSDFVMIGIRCMPWVAKDLFKVPVSEIYNSRIDLDLFNSEINSLHPQSLKEEDIDIMISKLQKLIIEKSDELTTEEAYIKFALTMILNSKGNIRIEKISKELNISSRHLRRVFKQELGCSPKEIGMRMKVREAISYYAEHEDITLSQLAYKSGYVDQSHFIRDFQSVVGLSPYQYFSSFEHSKFI